MQIQICKDVVSVKGGCHSNRVVCISTVNQRALRVCVGLSATYLSTENHFLCTNNQTVTMLCYFLFLLLSAINESSNVENIIAAPLSR